MTEDIIRMEQFAGKLDALIRDVGGIKTQVAQIDLRIQRLEAQSGGRWTRVGILAERLLIIALTAALGYMSSSKQFYMDAAASEPAPVVAPIQVP